jgi:hypothetical protein
MSAKSENACFGWKQINDNHDSGRQTNNANSKKKGKNTLGRVEMINQKCH